MNHINLHKLSGNVLYMKNAIQNPQEFIQLVIENDHKNALTTVLKPWEEWIDGNPVRISGGSNEDWDFELDLENGRRGRVKYIDWDYTLNEKNNHWPRTEISKDYDEDHEGAYEIVNKIDAPFREALELWAKETGNEMPKSISKNYTFREWKTGMSMGKHIDRNKDNPKNTMHWTALIYLNDDHEGGELVFDDLGYELSPEAGSIVFFPCDTTHRVKTVREGNKYYIFMFIHTDYGLVTALGEDYYTLKRLAALEAGHLDSIYLKD